MGKEREDERFNQIKQNIPSFITQEFNTLLYIGVGYRTKFQFQSHLDNLNYNITILEAHKPNLRKHRGKYAIINADITKFKTKRRWDIVMWWHGPEHISKGELKPTLQKLERMAKKLVILGCPWGKYVQGVVGGNPYEVHKTHLYPKDLVELGYSVKTLERPNKMGSNILAWKFI